MRRTRRLFLAVLILLAGGVGTSYLIQRASLRASEPPIPNALPANTRALSTDYVYYKGTRECPELEVRAKEAEGVEQPKAKFLLRGVEMRIYHNCGKKFDLVKAGSADFDESEGRLFADGEVDITLSVPDDETMEGKLIGVKSSGVLLDVKDGKARTDRYARFSFDRGDGEAVGAEYDPRSRELILHSNVKLDWRGRGGGKPMHIETGHLIRREQESKVYLSPWAKLQRDGLTMDAAETIVTLDKGDIRLVESRDAKGIDKQPNRALDFGANGLRMELAAHSQVEKIIGIGDARLSTTSPTAVTDIRTNEIHMLFALAGKESLLKSAVTSGKTTLESRPTAKPGAIQPHTRVLKSEGMVATMRENGEEIDNVEVHTPGEIDLIPNHPSQPKRWMSAGRMWIQYGEKNQLQSMRALQVATRTNKPRGNAKQDPPPAFTTSRELIAQFDPESGEMRRMEQIDDFKYKEGDREASAFRAVLEAKTDLITLDQLARAWDPTGSVAAKTIVLNQTTGDYTAEGDVTSTRLPDKKEQAKGSAMLARDEPMQAKAARMISSDRNRHVLYEGNAVLWQAANRLQADRVNIRRDIHSLRADGSVVSQFLDRKANSKTKKQAHTVVRAAALVYDDKERLAHYTGGVRMVREGMDVKAKELRAWLTPEKPADAPKQPDAGEESSLDHAFADGAVEIFQADAGRTRRGLSDHAEYYVAGEKVILERGNPQVVDSVKGITRGKKITFYSGNDELEVEGAETQPVVSKIRRK